jgi:hypothetical protein
LKGGAIVQTSAVAGDESLEELKEKLISYQNFMAKYIVEASEAKARAIAEAQASVTAKYEAKLLLGPVAAPAAAAAPAPKVYEDRNAHISKAAAAGKSRWGEAEVARIATGAAAAPAMQPVPAAMAAVAAAAPVATPPEVEEADHGLRADGGVGGPSLADRVNQGAALANDGGTSSSIYDSRNAHISNAAAAGKSRWGESEVARIATGVTAAPAMQVAPAALAAVAAAPMSTPPPQVEEADHGLRADGGVGGPTLADRVTKGAALAPANGAASGGASSTLYYIRNKAVAAAAGSSRWGPMEVAKAAGLAALPAPTSNGVDVQEADHGLRADGGVGGPSLSDRVNLGAQLLGQS